MNSLDIDKFNQIPLIITPARGKCCFCANRKMAARKTNIIIDTVTRMMFKTEGSVLILAGIRMQDEKLHEDKTYQIKLGNLITHSYAF